MSRETIKAALVKDFVRLREKTKGHVLHCECAACGARRQTGACLHMPYSGQIKLANVRLRG